MVTKFQQGLHALGKQVGARAGKIWDGQVDPQNVAESWAAATPAATLLMRVGAQTAAQAAQTSVLASVVAAGHEPSVEDLLQPIAFEQLVSKDALASVPVQVAKHLDAGETPAQAMQVGKKLVGAIGKDVTMNAGRDGMVTAMAAQPAIKGYIRVPNPPCCGRCAILAGRVYHVDGFARHPQCDCGMEPWFDGQPRPAEFDPRKYFDSLSEADQNKLFGKATADKIRASDGSIKSLNRAVNENRWQWRSRVITPSNLADAATNQKKLLEALRQHGFLTPVEKAAQEAAKVAAQEAAAKLAAEQAAAKLAAEKVAKIAAEKAKLAEAAKIAGEEAKKLAAQAMAKIEAKEAAAKAAQKAVGQQKVAGPKELHTILWDAGPSDSGATKDQLVTRLASALAPDGDPHSTMEQLGWPTYTYYQQVNDWIHNWANTSGDNDMVAMALQHVAEKVFKIDNPWRPWKGTLPPDRVRSYLRANHEEIMAAMLRQMQQETVALLRAKGITHVKVYRGMTLPRSQAESWKMGDKVDVRMQAMSSWSMSKPIASGFSHVGAGRPVMLEAEVPIEDLIGSFRTGFGCMSESEVVMRGGQLRGARVVGLDGRYDYS